MQLQEKLLWKLRFQFAVFLIVILIAEIAIGIVAFVNKDGFDTEIKNNVEEMFTKYNTTIDDTKAVDGIQKAVSTNFSKFAITLRKLKNSNV